MLVSGELMSSRFPGKIPEVHDLKDFRRVFFTIKWDNGSTTCVDREVYDWAVLEQLLYKKQQWKHQPGQFMGWLTHNSIPYPGSDDAWHDVKQTAFDFGE